MEEHLIIRSTQFAVFQQQADALFVQRVVKQLLRTDGEVVVRFLTYTSTVSELPRETLQSMVRSGIARARSYGMTWESTLVGFVSLMFSVAPNFDEHPLIRRVLLDENVPPDERIEVLWERVSEESWDAAGKTYDSNAWGINPLSENAGLQ